MRAMSKHLISCVETTVFSVVENMVFLFEAKPAYASYRVEWSSLINDFPCYVVLDWWSLVLEVPDVSGQFGLCSFSSLLDVGSVTIPSSLKM